MTAALHTFDTIRHMVPPLHILLTVSALQSMDDVVQGNGAHLSNSLQVPSTHWVLLHSGSDSD